MSKGVKKPTQKNMYKYTRQTGKDVHPYQNERTYEKSR